MWGRASVCALHKKIDSTYVYTHCEQIKLQNNDDLHTFWISLLLFVILTHSFVRIFLFWKILLNNLKLWNYIVYYKWNTKIALRRRTYSPRKYNGIHISPMKDPVQQFQWHISNELSLNKKAKSIHKSLAEYFCLNEILIYESM